MNGKHRLNALLAYFVLTLLLTYPLITQIGTKIIGDGGDGCIFAWNLWWFKKALFGLKTTPLFSNYIFYPAGAPLGMHTLSIFNCLLSLPLQLVCGMALTYNLLVLFSFVATAYGAYLLVEYMTGDRAAAFLGGFIFTFCPYKYAHLYGHLNLVSTEWIAFFVLYLVKSVRTGSRKDSVIAGIFLLLNLLCDFYYFLFLLVFIFVYLCWAYAERRIALTDRKFLLNTAAMLAVPLVCFLPVALSSASDIANGSYSFQGAGNYSEFVSDLLSPVTPSPIHPLFRRFVEGIYTGHFTGGIESIVFVGYTVLFLALYGAMKVLPRRKETGFWLYSAVIFFVLSLGPALHVFGKQYPVYLPSWVFRWLPLYSGIRSYGRFMVMAMLCLSVFAGYAYLHLSGRVRRKRLLAAGLFLLVLSEYLAVPFPLFDISPDPAYASITRDTRDCTVLEVPQGWLVGQSLIGMPDTRYQLRQTQHGKRLIGGIISRGSATQNDYFLEMPFIGDLYSLQANLPATAGRDKNAICSAIDYLGIGYVVAHGSYTKLVDSYLSGIPVKSEKLYEDAGTAVYRLDTDENKPGIGKKRENYVQYMYGWYTREQWAGGLFMHWSKGNSSTMHAAIAEPVKYRLKTRMMPFPFGSETQAVRVFINGKYLAAQRLAPCWKDYEFTAGPEYWSRGKNIIRFRYDAVTSPRKVYTDSSDQRELSIGMQYLKLESAD